MTFKFQNARHYFGFFFVFYSFNRSTTIVVYYCRRNAVRLPAHRTAAANLHIIIILYAQNTWTRLRLFFLSFYIIRFFSILEHHYNNNNMCSEHTGWSTVHVHPFFNLLMLISCSKSDFWIFRRLCFQILELFVYCSMGFSWR